ncbi:hypothetical protein [Marinobacterium rhizophilum]|nr:hypothetical protein [Marinobacterium rhizophilum]
MPTLLTAPLLPGSVPVTLRLAAAHTQQAPDERQPIAQGILRTV